MEFDVVDVTDPHLVPTVNDLRARGKSHVLPYRMMCGGLNQMVHDITEAATEGSVRVLRIWGHGTPSVVGISSGDDPRLVRLHLTGISPGAIASPSQQLWKLRPYFANGARFELRGCKTGLGADAEGLMLLIANTLAVEVHASQDDQSLIGLKWFGRVVAAKPGFKSLVPISGIEVN